MTQPAFTKSIQRRAMRIIEIAKALKGPKQTGQFFHCTFVFKKRKLIAIGINDYTKSHPEWKYGKYVSSREHGSDTYRPGLHSEIDALEKLDSDDTKHLEFWNVHICNNGSIGCSKPCPNCSRVLSEKGFKRLFYFDVTGQLQVLFEDDILLQNQ